MTKYYGSPRWTYEFGDCSMPMSFDTYNKCSYNCLYCFSYFQKSIKTESNKSGFKDYQKGELKYVNVEQIKRLFKGEIKNSHFNDFIKRKYYMQWGGLADQFDEYERRTGKTLELLKFFDEIDYPLSFSTKSSWFTKDQRYMDLIKKHAHNWHFKFSIINLDSDRARLMEKGVSSPRERLEAMKRISDLGCEVTLRMRPFIIGLTDRDGEYLKLIEESYKCGARSISTEFFCLDVRAMKPLLDRYREMSKIVGFDIYDYYKKYSNQNGYLRLNKELKRKYVMEMKKKCDELGMRFYVSDAHFKELCSNGSCCGLRENDNYFRGQLCEAMCKARTGNPEFTIEDLGEDVNIYKNIPWNVAAGSAGFGVSNRSKYGDMSLYEFLKRRWNDPNNTNSPYKYTAGAVKPIRKDEKGNIVYKLVKEGEDK